MKPDFQKGDGLIPVIVQDYQSHAILMLAYANEEAYQKMLETKETYFYSRSRDCLWHKGESSGHFQYIKGMSLDCDQDTLLVQVEQVGVACHTGAPTCFFDEVMPLNESTDILHDLYDLIEDRKVNPVEKSYTNYLLEQGLDKICKKIGEEASETIIAAKNQDKDEIIGEVSDLFYHVYVLLSQQGITVADIEKKLTERHHVVGNKKTFHQKGEY